MKDAIEKEIHEAYKRFDRDLVEFASYGVEEWYASSRCGFTLSSHATKEEAETAVIEYYRERMNLIRTVRTNHHTPRTEGKELERDGDDT